ncbi:Actin, alpha skeletal muscle [Neonectria magnoliae]|uniref:Actin, alpha skeletal muscle n=1 Tax=Neonectria magnoliae TaxID=2732573 RepID=A0ABR1HPH8_9HYPO
MTQIVYETFNVPAFYASIHAVLSLYVYVVVKVEISDRDLFNLNAPNGGLSSYILRI